MKNLTTIALFCLALAACNSSGGDGDSTADASSKLCTEKKLSAFAETKVAHQDALIYGTQAFEDHATLLCMKYKSLFKQDCKLDCSATSGTISDILCPNGDGQTIKLTDMWEVCDYFLNL